jgi:tryptophan synthase beta chain
MTLELSSDEKAELRRRHAAGAFPDARGRYGPFGGRYVPETLIPALERLEGVSRMALSDPEFQKEYTDELAAWVGRPTPLTFARRLSDAWGANIYLKREDLAHTGAHKINNALGQALLAKRIGARRVVAETGAGQHGVASAAACARLGLPCTVYMGAVDMERQAPNVLRMRLLGAEVVPVHNGEKTLRAAIDEAIRDWIRDPLGTHYLLGSAVGPHPYPLLVREFQSVIGKEARRQILEAAGRLPDAAVACVGGGSNAIGLFHPFLADSEVALVGVEAGGHGGAPGANSASIAHGRPGVLQGSYTLILQDGHGQILPTHSISAGLDYAGVGPEHALLQLSARARYVVASDDDALQALSELSRFEGVLAALESAHALAGAKMIARERPGALVVVGLSGRGDKDMATLAQSNQSHTRDPARVQSGLDLKPVLAHSRESGNPEKDWVPAFAGTSGQKAGGSSATGSPTRADRTTAPAPPSDPAGAVESAIRKANAEGRPALVAYLTGGYPDAERFDKTLIEVAKIADVVEVGAPFSDPMADGVTIQRASHAALQGGATLPALLAQLEALAPKIEAPLVLMSYLNPLLAFGIERLPRALADAGVAGVIVPDLPLEEWHVLRAPLCDAGLAFVPMVAPVTPRERIERIAKEASGFIYAVAMLGATGGAAPITDELLSFLREARASSPVPVCAGFGVRNPEQVRALAAAADGVVVGSALVECVESGESTAAFLATLAGHRD